MSITTKFGLAASLSVSLILLVAITGYLSLKLIRNAEKSIQLSSEIQRLVLEMDRGMENSRRLHSIFFLQYPAIGLEKAHENYAQPSIQKIAHVITTSENLKRLINQSKVSGSLRKRHVDLNLYLSSAKRFADTSIQSFELVTDLAAPQKGIEAQLERHLAALQTETEGFDSLSNLYHKITDFTQAYMMNRQRFLMQTAFNEAVKLKKEIEALSDMKPGTKKKAATIIDRYFETAEKILGVDVKIKSIFNDFSLQSSAIDPISATLEKLAAEEMKQAQIKINHTYTVALIIMVSITLLGLVTAITIARLLNNSITQKLVNITRVTGEFTKGNLDVSVSEDSLDELGQLAHTFNSMSTRIRELVYNLEDKVALRTRELESSNKQLLNEIQDRIKAEKENKKLEFQLHQAHKMEAIGTLAGGIAHDFNNILAAILGFAEMAKDDIPSTNPARYQINEVLTAANRAKDLVKQILSFSRKSQQSLEPIQISEIVQDVLKLLRASISTTIEIRQDICTKCGGILADATQIHQVLMNLCANAAQAMDENGGVLKVVLECLELTGKDIINEPDMKPGPFIKLSVKDTGCGIEKIYIDKIFDPYFTTKEVGKGSGMGLSVVHGIVKSYGGTILVESTPNKGTTFNVYLPRIDVDIHPKKKTPALLPGGVEHILVVDDEKPIADLTRLRLERLGYKVTAVTNSVEAFELFRSSPDRFDLVLTDQTMPKMTGKQIAKEMIKIKPNIPIVLCTGYSSKIDEQKARDIGIRAFALKPLDRNDLAYTIRQVLDGDNPEK